MRLSIKYLLGCLALLFLLPACKSNDEIEEATLDLSTEKLTFAKEGSEQSVTVSTNKESWLAFSTQEAWLSVEQQGSTLKVKATANEQGRDRAASVIVNAGGLQKRISVKQSAAEQAALEIEHEVTFSLEGGSHTITYPKAVADTKAELAAPAEWLSLTDASAKGFTLVAQANTTKLRRTAKVYVTQSGQTQEVTVTQEGDVPALEAYLTEHGFTLSKSTNQMAVYTNAKIPVSLQVYYFSDGAKFEFTYQPQQPEAYKTFTKLPMTNMIPYMGNRELNIPGKKRAEIRKAEEALGSEFFDVGDPSADVYQVKNSFDGEDVRAYLFVVANPDKGIPENDSYIDVCVGVNAFFPSITMGYWQDKVTGKHYLTNEVRAFFAGAGYPYLGKLKNGDHAFYNKERSQAYVLRAVDDGATQVLQVQSIYAKIKSANASLRSQLDYRASVMQRRADLNYLSRLVAPRVPYRAAH